MRPRTGRLVRLEVGNGHDDAPSVLLKDQRRLQEELDTEQDNSEQSVDRVRAEWGRGRNGRAHLLLLRARAHSCRQQTRDVRPGSWRTRSPHSTDVDLSDVHEQGTVGQLGLVGYELASSARPAAGLTPERMRADEADIELGPVGRRRCRRSGVGGKRRRRGRRTRRLLKDPPETR